MTTPRPIIGADPTPVPETQSSAQPRPPAPEMPIAKGLPSWDLVPSDLLLVRRKPVKK